MRHRNILATSAFFLAWSLVASDSPAQTGEVLFHVDFESPEASNFWDAGQGRIVQDETADNGSRVAAAVGTGVGICLQSAYVRAPHFTIGSNTWISFDYSLEEPANFRIQLKDRGLTPDGQAKNNVYWDVTPHTGKWVHVEFPAIEMHSPQGAKAGAGDPIMEVNFFMNDGVTGNPGLRVDNIRVEERQLTRSWAETVSAEGGIAVWAVPEGYKIDKFGKRIFVLDPNQRINALRDRNQIWDAAQRRVTLAGARGETLALQFIIESGRNGLNAVDVATSDFAGPAGARIPASRIKLFKVYYTQLKGKGSGPTNRPSMGEGWYPDALVPWEVGDTEAYGGYDGPPFAVAANEVQAVWADLAIPYGTPAGTYTGTFTVTAAGATPRTLSVSLKVYAFDIPREIHNTLFMNFGIDDLNQAGGYWMSGDTLMRYEDEVYRISRRHRFTAGNMYSRSRPAIEETTNGLVSVDWSAYDARWDKVLNPTNNVFGPGEAPIEIWRVPLSSPVWGNWPVNEKAWDQMILEIKRHWQERGWDLSKAYAYLADEPGKEVAEQLNDYAQRVKSSPGPNLRRQIAVYTILGKAWDQQQWVFDLWKDNLDMWMVAGDYYHVPSMNALPEGSLKGMYQGAEPFQGNETLDADGVAMRTWSWIAWQYRLDFLCYYCMSEAWRGWDLENWRQSENNNCEIWDAPRNRGWAISQGVFIYPGSRVAYNLPIVNIRMKQVRRGQTDYEYFWLLRQEGEGQLADTLCKGVLNVALSEAADAPEYYAAGKWSHDPAAWDQAIRAAAEKLDALARLPIPEATE